MSSGMVMAQATTRDGFASFVHRWTPKEGQFRRGRPSACKEKCVSRQAIVILIALSSWALGVTPLRAADPPRWSKPRPPET